MRLLTLFVLLMIGLACRASEPIDKTALRMNQVQVIGSHNSYKQPIDPPLLENLIAANASARGLDYSHPPLQEQLELGLRSFELDLYYDPDGGHYAKPLGLDLIRRSGRSPAEYDPDGAMQEPGFKILHVADIDFRSNCPTLQRALQTFRAWSEQHPDHLPIIITMNLKDKQEAFPNAIEPVRFDHGALDQLDHVIESGLGTNRLITPDLVRGDAKSLEAAVLERGWPMLQQVLGRYLWVIDEGGAKRDAYIEGHPSLAGRAMFTNSTPGTPEAAFLIRNNPRRDQEKIRRLVEKGYLVRTRADAATIEARRGDRSRFEAALASGAQVISTDYPRPDKRLATGYNVVFERGVYARRNAVTAASLPAADPVERVDE